VTEAPAFTPINLLTGFLGSGKTTLLRRLLQDPSLANSAVLINEFGEVGLDHHLLERIDETAVLLQSGCICCTIRGELSDAIRDLLSKRTRGIVPAFDRLIIESTGLADPFPILSTVRADPVLSHHFTLGNVVTLVDAVNAAEQIARHDESVKQIASADRLIITKSDIATDEDLAGLRHRLARLNPTAVVRDVHDPDWSADWLMTEDAALGDPLARWPGASDADGDHHHDHTEHDHDCRAADCSHPDHDHAHEHGHGHHHDANRHGDRIRAFAVTIDQPLDWTGFGIWLTMLLNRHGAEVLRVKGILNVAGEARPVAVHGVQHLVHPPVHMDHWPDANRASRLVFIVDGLDERRIRESLAAFTALDAPVPAG
jgi:G3E family GTPase